jgi:peptidoglycan/xylan/chitin deacetylase (PgdA/CDA1 family)
VPRLAIVRERAEPRVLFTAPAAVSLFDDLRVPYAVVPGERDRISTAGGRELRWASPSGSPTENRLGQIPVFAPVLPDAAAAKLLGPGWEPAEAVGPGSIWRSAGGDVFLPFDPGVAIATLRSEAYGQDRRSLARAAYYRLRPAMPRPLQLALRRSFARIQARTAFPRWPLEPALHDLQARLLDLLAGVAGEPVPTIAPWPAGYDWALVLTHDVETAAGYANVGPVRELEEAHGLRSSWNLVPERYAVDDEDVRELQAAGHEVGVHGLRHDGRDLTHLDERLPAIRAAAERWGARGFRFPATHRDWETMPRLGFEYDSSYPDTDPFEPRSGGCCSWLPFFNGDLVELPITLPQDHTVFTILRRDEALWIDKIEALRRRGGMALLITHPDYMLGGPVLEAYARLLAHYAEDASAWCALPSVVAAWWRRRAGSRIERVDGDWRVLGPATGEAAIACAEEGAPCW